MHIQAQVQESVHLDAQAFFWHIVQEAAQISGQISIKK
jgi:hypothetical protein